jgi:Ferritin-like domain
MNSLVWHERDREHAEVEPETAHAALSRAGLLGRLAAGFGAALGAGAGAAGLASAIGAPSSGHDRAVFRFAITLEHLQVAFYTAALKSGNLTGEVRQFAEVVAAEERKHLTYLSRAAGGHVVAPAFTFSDALRDQKSFVAAAVSIEENGLAAYNGQAGNLSPDALARVGRVISVEARHAAWARALAGMQPAPVAVDVPISAAAAQRAIKPYLA